MNKAPEDMKINDALDFFLENGAEIKFFNGRCNIEEQVGKITINKVIPGTVKDMTLFMAQLGKATELIKSRLKNKEDREGLEKLIEERNHYRAQLGLSDKKNSGKSNKSGTNPNKQTQKGDKGKTTQTPKGNNGKTSQDKTNSSSTGSKKAPVTKVEYIRKSGEEGAGNKVTIMEMSANKTEFKVNMPSGEIMSILPPYVNPAYIIRCKAEFGVDLDIKRYMVIELSKDKKTMFVNVLYGNLDLDLMSQESNTLALYMNSILSRKSINETCRNHFCTLGNIKQTGPKAYTVKRDDLVDKIVARSILENSEEVKTEPPKSLLGLLKGKKEPENIIRFYKTGVMVVGGKQCLVYSYATKDHMTGEMVETGSFIISGLNEERFANDKNYHDAVIRNVITPSRLMNSRRRDILYPYIGQVTEDGGFENNFEIDRALNNIQIQL